MFFFFGKLVDEWVGAGRRGVGAGRRRDGSWEKNSLGTLYGGIWERVPSCPPPHKCDLWTVVFRKDIPSVKNFSDLFLHAHRI